MIVVIIGILATIAISVTLKLTEKAHIDALKSDLSSAYKASSLYHTDKPDEDVTIEISETAGNKVIMFGEVNNEGVYLYNGTISLFEAIAMAGGITSSGQRDSIIVVSDNFTKEPKVRRINLIRAIRKGSSTKDLFIKPDDIIYVPRTFISDFNRFLSDLDPALDLATSVFDWRDRIRTLYKHYYK